MAEEKKGFPLEKIVTASARDVCKADSQILTYYQTKGVHASGLLKANEYSGIFYLAQQVPKGTEWVVDFQESVSASPTYRFYSAHGTALVKTAGKE